MAPKRSLHRLLTASAAFAVVLSALPVAAQERVGVDTAVNPAATGTPPGGTARPLAIKEDVVFNEHIATSAKGQTQILFLDQSSMTIGPDSDLTINEFVYHRNGGSGRLAMSTLRGVFRYVGGKVSKQGAVTLKTPLATISVRGGVLLGNQAPNGRLDVYFVYGNEIDVTAAGVTETLRRPGFAITVPGPGAPPSAPYRAAPAILAALEAELDGQPGENGGAPVVPSEALVTASGIGNAISGNYLASLEAAERNDAQASTPGLLDPTGILTALQANSIQAQSDNHIQFIYDYYVLGIFPFRGG